MKITFSESSTPTKRKSYIASDCVNDNRKPHYKKNRAEGNLQPDDEIVTPQDDLYVITWETKFGDFPRSDLDNTPTTSLDAAETFNRLEDDASLPGEIFTDVDLRSTGPDESGNFDPPEKTRSEHTNDRIDDQQSSGKSKTIVPEVSDDENDDMIVENESPRVEEKNNRRPKPTPTSLMNTDTSQTFKLKSPSSICIFTGPDLQIIIN